MSDKKRQKQVRVDPECIQEALRTYLQPIKTDDPQLDLYTMYKRETTVYDTEYMQKYNEDLNTTLIFAGLFSAVSSAFVIDVQSKLEPDPGDQSEAYLRAILLSLNPSISPNEGPTDPSVWNGPPQEIITTSAFLYASLLMSVLAAFVAMLGKQWLNRYLRHTGTSMVERCGDRQRKFNGLEKWPFRPFIESLPIMLQIALLFLTCGLSRYTWSLNASVGRVVITFTLLGFLFYIGIVIAGVSSYECPFQTPASEGLRYLVDSGIGRKVLTSLRPANVLSLCHSVRRNARKVLQIFSLFRIASLVYVALADALGRAVSASRRAYEITRDTPLEISPLWIIPCIQGILRRVGDEFLIRLLQIDRVLGNARQRLAQWFRRFWRATLLPITDQRPTPPSDQELRFHVRNLEALRKQNANNARCVSWVLRNITDPEAIDSAIRLGGNIRWFDSDLNNDPPYGLIVSIFEACFDSAKEVYPGMRDRAYFSARAILQIHARARAQSNEGASRYPIPPTYECLFYEDEDDFRLYDILPMLENVSRTPRITLDLNFATVHIDHSLWLSNLFVELTRVGPNPILKGWDTYLHTADVNNRAIISNTLLMWYMLLGGHVEEETFWVVDRSDSLEAVLSHLSKRVTSLVVGGLCFQHLEYLLVFLAAWKERPYWLTSMTYLWCILVSGPPGRLWSNQIQFIKDIFELELFGGQHDLPADLYPINDEGFALVGPGCDQIRLDYTLCCTRQRPEGLTPRNDVGLFSITLQIALRLTNLPHGQSPLDSNPLTHYDRAFETIFSNEDDEVIADATCILAVDTTNTPSSFFRYFPRRAERNKPFSPRLRRVCARVVEPAWRKRATWNKGVETPTPELVYLFKVNVGDFVTRYAWIKLLLPTLRSPVGLENLSSHYWELLDKVLLAEEFVWEFPDIGVLRHLEQAKDWDKLEVWVTGIWKHLSNKGRSPLEDVERATLELLLQKPSALPRFEDLCKSRRWTSSSGRKTLQRICDKSRAERSHPQATQSLPRSSSLRPPLPPPSAEADDDTD